MTLLVLAAQYESWTDPVAVILSMPIAVLGTVMGCMIMGQSISIYTQIGLILLLGMSAKNAILIVEYAMDFRKSGIGIRQAAHDAGVIRFRPIMHGAQRVGRNPLRTDLLGGAPDLQREASQRVIQGSGGQIRCQHHCRRRGDSFRSLRLRRHQPPHLGLKNLPIFLIYYTFA